MTERFAIDKKGTVHNNIVDTLQPKPNGPGIIATSHSDLWAQTIIDCLNYCVVAEQGSIPAPSQSIIPPQPKAEESDHDT